MSKDLQDLKRIIALQHRELLAKNERLKGVEELTRICNELEEKWQDSKTRAENYETALRRAEARIAYLSKKLGIGPQMTFDIDVVNRGISRKDFDAVVKENINRLKEALEHTVPTELGGKDIVIFVFSEKLLKENKRLNELVDQQKGLVVVDQDVPDGQAIENKMNVNENATASATNAMSNKEQEKMVEEKEKVILEQAATIQELLTKIEDASKRIAELSTEVAKTNEGKQKVESELSETAKKCSDFQNQVVSLNLKQQESEEEISSQKGSCENLRAQVAEKEAMIIMMRDSLKTHEDDFRRENEEKAGIQERLRCENQAHMATIRRFESEV